MISASNLARDVRSGRQSAAAILRTLLATIKARDYFVGGVGDRALLRALAIDSQVAAGGDPGPLAGVPFGVKDLFDIKGLPTIAGAAMRRDAPPAQRDSEAIRRLEAAGAILTAKLNMDEFAYGFATINAAFGTTSNPHDPSRLAGGSSGGSAAAVAAGMLPLTLGSDTNGSIRIPAALCGVYGLKPTHGGLPMQGVFPFVDSFDDIGPFAATLADLRLAWEVLGGTADRANPAPRVAALGGWFARNVAPELRDGIAAIGARLGGIPTVELPEVATARSAAFVMTAVEGGTRHLPELRARAQEFDPQTRDRLIAGALLPGSAYLAAQRFRSWFRAQALALFARHDVLIAPSAGVEAPRIDDPMIEVDGKRVPARAHLGIHTQPISFIGLPVIAAPLLRPGKLPLGIQLIGKPGAEATLFALAERLEAEGLTGFSPTAR